MSAFMVSDETINGVLGYFRSLARSADGRWILKPLTDRGFGYNLQSEDGVSALGDAMFQLNKAGVNSRYGADQAQEFRPLDYEFESMLPSRMQAYKSLGSFLYQCAEGKVPEKNLYKALREIENRIAHDIVQDHPDYESARWG